MDSITVHICDDHPLIIQSVNHLLSLDDRFQVVSTSSNKQSLIAHLKADCPHVLILDVNLHGANMLDVLSEIKEFCPKVKIIILTSYESNALMNRAFDLGVHAFLNKNTDVNELKNALEKVLTNKIYSHSSQVFLGTISGDFQLHPELTHREREIIKLLIDGFPNKKISDRLNISLATVQTHRRNIYKKLNLKGIGELIAFAYENNIQSASSEV